MTKAELAIELRKGRALCDVLDLRDGEECLIYKADTFDFDQPEQIVYIPDLYLNDVRHVRPCCDEEELRNVLSCAYTVQDFIDECEGRFQHASILFELVRWQHPNYQDVLEILDDEELEEIGR